jgi:hypothetical protein
MVPPLSFKKLRSLENDIKELAKLEGPATQYTGEQLKVFLRIVHAALSRNYPDMTLEDVEEILDLGNVRPVVAAILGISGLEPTKGEVAPRS